MSLWLSAADVTVRLDAAQKVAHLKHSENHKDDQHRQSLVLRQLFVSIAVVFLVNILYST